MIVIYKTLSKSVILKEAKETVPQIEKWFVDNPKRKVCHAQFWYGKMADVRRGHVKDDIDRQALNAINNK